MLIDVLGLQNGARGKIFELVRSSSKPQLALSLGVLQQQFINQH